MTSDWPSFGRVRMMARQYIAMMKFGFMPPMLMTEPAKNLSTAPAASKTAVRIRLRISAALPLSDLTTLFSAVLFSMIRNPFRANGTFKIVSLAGVFIIPTWSVQSGIPENKKSLICASLHI